MHPVLWQVFPHLTLPSLQSLSFIGFVMMDDLSSFLPRHPQLQMLSFRSHNDRLTFPTEPHARLSLDSISKLAVSCQYVEPFFCHFDVLRLKYLDLHLGQGTPQSPIAALHSLSEYSSLHAISLRLTFHKHLTSCIPHPICYSPLMLLHLTRLSFDFKVPFLGPDTFVSQVASTLINVTII